MTPPARWTLAPPASRAALLHSMQEFGVSPLMAQVIQARGLSQAHLTPERRLTPNPGLREAAGRLVAAIKGRQRVRIHGDYDADGVTATAVLLLGLRALGADVHGFIPHRLNEGYGVHPDKVAEHAERADLLLTVDCGVTNTAEVRALLDAGTQVIVTDHHAPGPDFPECLVVHPHLTPDFDEALHNLTGAGVAYHLLWAVHAELGLPEPTQYADLATIGIVADVAPLVGENRALVTLGLRQLLDSQHPGVRALVGTKKTLSTRDVAFILAPRINAAGRLGEADLALELLTTASPRRAAELATYLESRNNDRRVLQDQMFKEALTLVDPEEPAIVVTKDTWHAGVMGIVASKLLETYHKPVYIVAQGKGSVRSTPGISAVGGLWHAKDLLKRFGGHPGAAGFAIADGNFDAFRRRLHQYAEQHPVPVPEYRLDGAFPGSAAVGSIAQEFEAFEPYGQGHARPLWWVRGPLSGAKLVGKSGSTLQFSLDGVRGVKYSEPRTASGERDLAANVTRDRWQGRERVEYFGEALRPPAALHLDSPLQVPPLARLEPREAMAHLRAGASVYAEGSVAAYLKDNIPGLGLLESGQRLHGEVILYALPPEDDLRAWLRQGRVAFAWGPKTLAEIGGVYGYHLEGLQLEADTRILAELGATDARQLSAGQLWASATLRELAADAYRRWQWAQLYSALDAPGWSQAVHHLLGLADEVLDDDLMAGPEVHASSAD